MKPRMAMSRDPLDRLRDAVLEHYREGSRGADAAAAMLRRVITRAEAAPRAASIEAARVLPVRQWLATALSEASSGPFNATGTALGAAELQLAWLQNPNYPVSRMGAGFVAGYGYVELVGPERTFRSNDVRIGFLLLAPGIHYPDHAHAAEETYHVVAGTADWWREGDGWTKAPAGTMIHHAPHVRHAMRAGTAPMLALYAWIGEVGPPADLTQ